MDVMSSTDKSVNVVGVLDREGGACGLDIVDWVFVIEMLAVWIKYIELYACSNCVRVDI